MSELRFGVLASGRGSNFARLAEASASGELEARPAVLISDNPGATVLERARKRDIPARHLCYDESDRKQFERDALGLLRGFDCELVLLAGFMRILTGYFLDHYPERVLNIHPSLLPSFKGLDAQAQALEHGVKITGCTVHLVTEELDAGPILAQEPVRVREHDTRDTLAHRILEVEHELYPRAVQRFIERHLGEPRHELSPDASKQRPVGENEVVTS